MSEYLTLTEFVPGTKAKAQEVNENFSILKDAINAKASMNGDAGQSFSVANATSSSHAVNKSQMDTSVNNLKTAMDGLNNRFSLLNGNLSSGESDLMAFSGSTLSFKIGGSYAPLNWVCANGTIESVTSLPNITGLSTNGTYNVVKEYAATNAIATASKVTQGKTFPTTPADGDYHCLVASGINTYKRISGNWVETQYIDLGTVTIAGSVITSVTSKPYLQNGFDINAASQGFKMPNLSSVVSKVWNTTYNAECDGWIFVSSVTSNVVNSTLTINSLVVWQNTSGANGDINTGFIPIAKGSTYIATGGASSQVIKFIPAKGV